MLVVAVSVGFARDHVLDPEREPEVSETEQGARACQPERRRGDGEQQGSGGLDAAAEDEQGRASAAVREAAERDREEEWDERERGGDEPDLARPRAECEQAVRRRRTRDVDRGLRDRERRDREGQPAAQFSTTVQASAGMCTFTRPPATMCGLCAVSASEPASSSYW